MSVHQGQYEDEETGLYYNRFRYYSPDEGRYISQDPIRLDGVNPTLYGFVWDINFEIDPFGLVLNVSEKIRIKPIDRWLNKMVRWQEDGKNSKVQQHTILLRETTWIQMQ
ncbi:RHS repeat-associated core domain-containing protein [Tannerella forsythia]|uniref:RHS repeat-associated core domain-containing protein n=1 Tax=Tannerella forsythia TaxID=28112 RepID=UPI0028E3E513|nr:RHS repeat-associated core domain-containing protein [Tannerella forsythia]